MREALHCKGFQSTPGGTRIPNLLIRSHTTLMPARTAQCCHDMPSTDFRLVAVPWGTVLYRPVPRRWVADRVAERSPVRGQISSVGGSAGGGTARSAVAWQRPP